MIMGHDCHYTNDKALFTLCKFPDSDQVLDHEVHSVGPRTTSSLIRGQIILSHGRATLIYCKAPPIKCTYVRVDEAWVEPFS